MSNDKKWEINLIIPIYYYKFKLVLCESVNDYIFNNQLAEGEHECKAIVIDFDENNSVDYSSIIIFSADNIKHDLISHEAFHLLCLIMRSRGFTLSKSSEECCAYLQGYLHKVLAVNLIKLRQLKNGITNT